MFDTMEKARERPPEKPRGWQTGADDRGDRRPGAVLTALRVRARTGQRFRRGVYLLPSALTLANLFCGYVCIMYAMRGDYAVAAPFIGIAMVLDMLDGRLARLTGSTSSFGFEFDSLADVISFGVAPAILVLAWGLEPLGRVGWAAGFIFVSSAAMRLARFNSQSTGADKRYFVGMPSPAAATVPAATVYAFPTGPLDTREALLALVVVLVPAFLMISTVRYRSFKDLAFGRQGSYRHLILAALAIGAMAIHPQAVLLTMSYAYLASGLVGNGLGRLRRRGGSTATRPAAPTAAGEVAPFEDGSTRHHPPRSP